jgi:hydrogenase maturation protein HypF
VIGVRLSIRGTVQGVGFRPWIARLASRCGARGRVWNDGLGVTLELHGGDAEIASLVNGLSADLPPAAAITSVSAESIAHRWLEGFEIVASDAEGAAQISFPADLAICEICRSEIHDPKNRRFRYAFTNCTHCGPRYTIVERLPYDRASTTMSNFRLCPICHEEYTNIRDRRFHAEPNACPSCGPKLWLLDAAGKAIRSLDPIRSAAEAICAGQIVALKGIGGFHLAVDATDQEAVLRLRLRKRREAKPLAVMVATVEDAERLALLSEEERRCLLSVERPIVIASRREVTPLAPSIAQDARTVGLILAYSPLHILLVEATGRPLVMTSGNLADEPIARTTEEAQTKLGGVVDLILTHDREIKNRIDDSVVRVVAKKPLLLRRARGFVPRSISLSRPFARPVVAAGGLLKNTFCVGHDAEAILGPHIGDLDDADALATFEEALERLLGLLRISPEVIAHDLHPDFWSTRWAQNQRCPLTFAIQHHHAHVVSVAADNGLEGPVLGFAWDGAGLGADGSSWGGELLLATFEGYRRIATFRPIALAGGDRAIREVWRVAIAAFDDALGNDMPWDRLALFKGVTGRRKEEVRQVIDRGLAQRAHGVGRWFDALGAILFDSESARYEGEVAVRLEHAADPGERRSYRFDFERDTEVIEVDLRPMLRAVVDDLTKHVHLGTIAARFHETLILAAREMVRFAVRDHGRLPVVLGGGCFQNARLAEGVMEAIAADGLKPFLPRRSPPGDGGISLGQAVIADALARRVAGK